MRSPSQALMLDSADCRTPSRVFPAIVGIGAHFRQRIKPVAGRGVQRAELVDGADVFPTPPARLLVDFTLYVEDDGSAFPHKQIREHLALGLAGCRRRDGDER